jgi:hypothetical protein
VTTLDIFYTCNKIAWRWVATGIGSGKYAVKGIDTFTINPAGQIQAVYAEFNSGAWAADLAPVSGSSAPSSSSSSAAPKAT